MLFPLTVNYVSMLIHTPISCSCYVYESGVIILSWSNWCVSLENRFKLSELCVTDIDYLTTVKKCSPILFPVTGNMTCVDSLEPFSFGSRCNFTCHEGYYLTGDTALTCLASGQWSNPTPTCTGWSQNWCQGLLKATQTAWKYTKLYTALMSKFIYFPVIQCNRLKAPLNASIQCHNPLGEYSYGSICTVQCALGFDLIGTNMTQCSSQGNWSHSLPVCRGMYTDD